VEEVDLVIKSGTVVRSQDSFKAGIAIKDGKIVAIAVDSQLPPAKEVIDAKGKVVMAGVIDPHVHMREPGVVERGDWITGTSAAAAGGVTTVLDHPNSLPPVSSAQVLLAKKDLIGGRSLIDFGLFGGSGQTSIERIAEQAEAGAVAFKTFPEAFIGREDEFEGIFCTNDDALLTIFEEVAKTGLIQTLHAETKAIVDHYAKKLSREERRNPFMHGKARPVLAEVEMTSRAILLAMETGVRLSIPHISSGSAAALVKEARDRGHMNITGETCPHYLMLTEERMKVIGPFAKITPPLRAQEEQDRLWEVLLASGIYTLGSDHAPHLPRQKEAAWDDILTGPAGTAGLETMLPVMLTAVNQGKLDLQTLTKLNAENPAKLFGLYPRKGVIQVGSDADLVIVDMTKEMTLDRNKTHYKQKDSARMFDGWDAVGMPVMTIVRGSVIMRDGKVVGKPGHGRFLSPAQAW